jgi:hypothetical protein
MAPARIKIGEESVGVAGGIGDGASVVERKRRGCTVELANEHAADQRLLRVTLGETPQCGGVLCGCETNAIGVGANIAALSPWEGGCAVLRRARPAARQAGSPAGRAEPYRPPELPAGKVNTTDPDSRSIPVGLGFVQGYNAQAAVNEQQIVVAAEITNNSTDFSQLDPMVTATLDELERAGIDQLPEAVAADAGYWNEHDEQAYRWTVLVLDARSSGGVLSVSTNPALSSRGALVPQARAIASAPGTASAMEPRLDRRCALAHRLT